MATASRNADDGWKSEAWLRLVELATSQAEVTSDDLWATGLEVPPQGAQALGALFSRAAREGILHDSCRIRQSKRPSNHATRMRIWESLVYQARVAG